MSAPIVYEGKVQGHGGTLFKDMKFWVAHRVPMRSTWIQDIENNGGSVVQLDKHADFLIADHAKRDVPAGSYSWKWIEETVKRGRLMEREDYLIGAPGHESRPAGSVPQKSTRNAFTKQDDLLLAQFVTKYERQGIAVSGNVIYKRLEAKHPHHTFQSWRDRWVKKLQFLPRPHVSDSSPSPPPADARGAISARSQVVPNSPSQAPASSRHANASSALKKTRARYTHDEDETLLQYVDEMRSHGKGVSGNKMYQDFALDFPQHTWQAWRDRYLTQLRPREGLDDAEDTPQPSPARSNARDRPASTVEQASRAAAATGQNYAVAEPSQADVRLRPSAAHSIHTDIQQEVIKPEPPSSSLDEPQPRQQLNGVDGLQENTESEDAELDGKPPTQQQSKADHRRSQSLGTSSELGQEVAASRQAKFQSQYPIIGKREDFYQFLKDFRESATQVNQKKPSFWPTIQGRTFELWDLWTAVQRQKAEPAERDWQQISEEVGYDWIQRPGVPDQLLQFYEEHLSDFEQLMLRYGTADSDDGEEEEGEEDEEEDESRAETPQPPLQRLSALPNVLSDGQFNSSPPKQPSLKRPRESAIPDLAYPEANSRKRPRVDRDGEIPSTPDEKNGTLHLRPPISAGVSPNDRGRHALPKSSQFLQNKGKGKQVEVDDEEMDDGPSKPPAQLIPGRPALEPETQDFRFETQIMDDLQDEESQPEITPSQQLQADIDAEKRRQQLNNASPTPRRKFVKSPFLVDEENEVDEVVVPKPRYGKGPNPLLPQSGLQGSKRRSLPASFAKRMEASASARKSISGRSSASTHLLSPAQQRTMSPAPAQPTPRIRSKAEELADVVDYWMSLGYSHDHARRSLEATTWEPGLAGRIMQMLKEGQPIPNNWEGVWTARDDEHLKLIESAEPPIDEKEAKKRRKAADRLNNKHGEERMQLRRKWLVAKAGL